MKIEQYCKSMEESLDNIRTQIESISNNDTNSHNYLDASYSQSIYSQMPIKPEYLPLEPFTNKFDRRNIIVDLDRTFIDIMEYGQFQTKLKSLHSHIRNAFCNEGDLHEIVFNGLKFVVVIRKGTKEFFQQLSKKYTLYCVSYIFKDLLLQLLRLVDPLETAFASRHTRVKFYDSSQPKNTSDVLENAYNTNDYIVIDRIEQSWLYKDQKKLLLLKTFAPLSGPVLTEENLG